MSLKSHLPRSSSLSLIASTNKCKCKDSETHDPIDVYIIQEDILTKIPIHSQI